MRTHWCVDFALSVFFLAFNMRRTCASMEVTVLFLLPIFLGCQNFYGKEINIANNRHKQGFMLVLYK